MSKTRIQEAAAIALIIGLSLNSACSRKKGSMDQATGAQDPSSVTSEHPGGPDGSESASSGSSDSAAQKKGEEHAQKQAAVVDTGTPSSNPTDSAASASWKSSLFQKIFNFGRSKQDSPTTSGAAIENGAKPDLAATHTDSSSGKPVEQGPQCFTVSYVHKKLSAHNSDEACSQHKNLLKLKHENVNPKSICVRVNGTPVRFLTSKKQTDEVMIGAIAGPDAKITARYCTGKASCSGDCSIPKDEFMDAIGGSDDAAKPTQISEWTSVDEVDSKTTAKLNADLKKELKDLDDDAPGTSEGFSIFKDWTSESETPSCGGTHQAKAENAS